MKKLLDKTEGAEKSAYPTSEKESVKHNDSENVIGSGLSTACKRILKRAQGASARSTGAGVAVKSGGARVL